MTYPLIPCTWTGHAFNPLRPGIAQSALTEGHRYVLEVAPLEYERSHASHAAYFAEIANLWQSLPERLSSEPWALTADLMRDYALIRTGHVESEVYSCATHAEAVRWAAMPPKRRNREGRVLHRMINVEGAVLAEFWPRSQSYRSMKNREFQISKADVLAFLSDLIGVTE